MYVCMYAVIFVCLFVAPAERAESSRPAPPLTQTQSQEGEDRRTEELGAEYNAMQYNMNSSLWTALQQGRGRGRGHGRSPSPARLLPAPAPATATATATATAPAPAPVFAATRGWNARCRPRFLSHEDLLLLVLVLVLVLVWSAAIVIVIVIVEAVAVAPDEVAHGVVLPRRGSAALVFSHQLSGRHLPWTVRCIQATTHYRHRGGKRGKNGQGDGREAKGYWPRQN